MVGGWTNDSVAYPGKARLASPCNLSNCFQKPPFSPLRDPARGLVQVFRMFPSGYPAQRETGVCFSRFPLPASCN